MTRGLIAALLFVLRGLDRLVYSLESVVVWLKGRGTV